jgi:hypothetical protein
MRLHRTLYARLQITEGLMGMRLIFHHVEQDAPKFGSTEARPVSRAYFDLEVDGETFKDLYVNVEEPVGGSHATQEISVGELKAALLPIDQDAFKQAVRGYYQRLMSSAGNGKHLAKEKSFCTQGDKLGLVQVVEL